MIDDTLFFMLVVGLVISAAMLFLFIWAAKSGQFDDASKMTNGMLFDSVEDLNDAIRKEKNLKEAKQQKIESEKKKEEEKASHID